MNPLEPTFWEFVLSFGVLAVMMLAAVLLVAFLVRSALRRVSGRSRAIGAESGAPENLERLPR